MARYDHVVWDWNGTLFDDAWLCRDIVNGLLAQHGKPALSEQRYQEVFDFPVRDYYRRAGFDFSRVPYEILANRFIEQYETRRGECRLRNGAMESLQRCRGLNVTQSILSVYPQRSLAGIVEALGIRGFFASLYGLENHYAAGKVEIGRRMMRETGHFPQRTVLVGDTTHDWEVAQTLGIGCVLMPGGHHARARLETCGTIVKDSLAEAAAWILGGS
jgi:phosphoglycolate phosphatase